MDGRFSVGDIADGFWSPHAPPVRLEDDAVVNAPSSSTAVSSSEMLEMGRSSSESAFQRFLQEAAPPDPNSTALQRNGVVEIKGNHPNHNFNPQQEIRPPPNNPIDSTEYLAFLRNRLELACAAVALTRATNSKAQESAAATSDMVSQASDSSQYKVSPQDSLKVQHKHAGGPVGIPPLPTIFTKSVAQVRSTTSGSSGEQSDDDADGDTETTLNMDPADAKRRKRMLSNRESARRSRRRKQAHLTELETQVSQIRDENSSLLKRLSEINQKHNEAAVDNRVLKADIETLRAKVKMAEETVKRVTGLNPLFQSMPEMSPASIPGFGKSPDASAGAPVPVQDDQKRHYYHAPNSHISDDVIQNGLIDIPAIQNVRPKATIVGTTKDGRTVSSRE